MPTTLCISIVTSSISPYIYADEEIVKIAITRVKRIATVMFFFKNVILNDRLSD